MSRNRRFIVMLGLLLVPASCRTGPRDEAFLKTGASAVCDRERPLVISMSDSGRFSFNGAAMDSAKLAKTLLSVLRPTPPPGNLVMVENVNSRALSWVVPAIRAGGGSAYALDTACLRLPRGARRSAFLRH